MRDPSPDRPPPIECAIAIFILALATMMCIYFPTLLKLFHYHKPVCKTLM